MFLLFLQLAFGSADDCKSRYESIPEIHFVKKLSPGKKEITSWSSDLLLSLVLSLEQEVLTVCPGKEVKDLTETLKKTYLNRLGVTEISDLKFRGLIAAHEEFQAIKKRLTSLKPNEDPLVKIYGTVSVLDGVVVLSKKPISLEPIQALRKKLPPAFWNKEALYKVLITDELGIAAYVPETATLILSRTIFDTPNLLHQVILLHELTHVAERDAAFRKKENWANEFARFSGWTESANPKPVFGKGKRNDTLSQLAKNSDFPFLPDSVYIATERNGKRFEGFVFGRTYERVATTDDVSEDLADHVAAAVLVPERFVFEGSPIAPEKLKWIKEKVLR